MDEDEEYELVDARALAELVEPMLAGHVYEPHLLQEITEVVFVPSRNELRVRLLNDRRVCITFEDMP